MSAKMSPPKFRGTHKPAPEPDPDTLTGEQFARVRKAFKVSQAKLAEELGVNLRTVIRLEAQSSRRKHVPLVYAKLMRCLARERGANIAKIIQGK